ncbi:Protein of unknown function [Gryllus bimaculatus]|nr:Protein of unknown function [Gryllus bimaculatus]
MTSAARGVARRGAGRWRGAGRGEARRGETRRDVRGGASRGGNAGRRERVRSRAFVQSAAISQSARTSAASNAPTLRSPVSTRGSSFSHIDIKKNPPNARLAFKRSNAWPGRGAARRGTARRFERAGNLLQRGGAAQRGHAVLAPRPQQGLAESGAEIRTCCFDTGDPQLAVNRCVLELTKYFNSIGKECKRRHEVRLQLEEAKREKNE